jgi:hypothetical protein
MWEMFTMQWINKDMINKKHYIKEIIKKKPENNTKVLFNFNYYCYLEYFIYL